MGWACECHQACGRNEGDPSDTKAAVQDTGWGDNVTIAFGDSNFRFRSNGVPNHSLQAEYVMPDDGTTCVPHPTTDCTHIEPVSTAVQANDQDYRVTTTPQKVTETVSLPFGPMGVMISGAPVYNPYEGDGTTVAMNANFTLTNKSGQQVAFMDSCNGHPSPYPLATYH